MRVVVEKSKRADKRLQATFGNKTVHFGAKGGRTFVDHRDAKTKAAWEARHRVNENWSDYASAGALAKHILWNKPTIAGSIRDLNGRQKQYQFVLKGG
mgnify:CR=1 FL=1